MSTRPRMITAHGETRSLSEWSRVLGLSKSSVERRLRVCDTAEEALVSHRLGMDDEEMWPGANVLPWEHDPIARAIVDEMGPMTLSEVGRCLGLSRERVRQIEAEALSKLAKKNF